MPPATPTTNERIHISSCWHAASEALLDCYSLASRTKLLPHHGNVVVKIIIHVEARAVLVRIEHADLDHDLLPVQKRN
jgi:hypothetical protein